MNGGSYYKRKLAANRLLLCYETAPRRIRQYLDSEIRFVASNIKGADTVLELGCGYGRVMKEISRVIPKVVGIDNSKESLALARNFLENVNNYAVLVMDASQMAFRTHAFDSVICVQNGVSAFGVVKERLIAEAVRVTKFSGTILFSSYSPKIWEDRLDWFRKQSQLGLIGEIDEEKTGNGTIVCKDGFRATTVEAAEFIEMFSRHGLKASIVEVDESSVFCKVVCS